MQRAGVAPPPWCHWVITSSSLSYSKSMHVKNIANEYHRLRFVAAGNDTSARVPELFIASVSLSSNLTDCAPLKATHFVALIPYLLVVCLLTPVANTVLPSADSLYKMFWLNNDTGIMSNNAIKRFFILLIFR